MIVLIHARVGRWAIEAVDRSRRCRAQAFPNPRAQQLSSSRTSGIRYLSRKTFSWQSEHRNACTPRVLNDFDLIGVRALEDTAQLLRGPQRSASGHADKFVNHQCF